MEMRYGDYCFGGRTLSYCIPDLAAVRLWNKHVKVDDGGDEGMMRLGRCCREV